MRILAWARRLFGGPRIDPEIKSLGVLACRHALDGAPVRFIARAPQGLVAMCEMDGHVDDDSLGEDDVLIVCLGHLLDHDPSVAILATLPTRLCARRAERGAGWEFDDIAEATMLRMALGNWAQTHWP